MDSFTFTFTSIVAFSIRTPYILLVGYYNVFSEEYTASMFRVYSEYLESA
jgi:hypothetical protein